VEAAAQRRVAEVIEAGCPRILGCDLTGQQIADDTPICGGSVRVLLAPIDAPLRAACDAAALAARERCGGLLWTTIRHGDDLQVDVAFHAEHAFPFQPGFPDLGTIQEILHSRRPRLLRSDGSDASVALEILLEPVLPRPRLLIVGGGHVGQAVAAQAQLVGFELVVFDDRREFVRDDLFPEGTTTQHGEVGSLLRDYPIDRDSYVVIATRGHSQDAAALEACLHRPAGYVGMIGSRRKVTTIREALIACGKCTGADFDRIHAPIGLDIGAETVPEIAASIVGQLIQVRRRADPSQVEEGSP
jgi:xanthine dehydrogenase accessory factor